MGKLYGTLSIVCLIAAEVAIENGFFVTSVVLGIMFGMFFRLAAIEEGVWR